jgi:hypothetical protein
VAATALLVFAAPAQGSLSAVTQPATTLTPNLAILAGEVDPSGSLPSYYFEYGLTSAYGAQTPAIPFVTRMKVQATVAGLAPGTTYHFRVVAKREDRAARGADMTFTTATSLLPDSGSGLTPPGTVTDPLSGLPVVSPASGGNGTAPARDPGSAATGDPAPDDPARGGSPYPGDYGVVTTAPAGATTAPVLGTTVGAAPDSGSILVRPPGEDTFAPLDDGASIPVGSTVDSRRGRVRLVTSVGTEGAVQAATFHGAVFQVRQRVSGGGLTDIVLRGGDFGSCGRATVPGRAGVVSAARTRRPIRRLWGRDHHGSFRTHGRGSIATVRGTTWAVADYCDGTRTSVSSGAVEVWDKGRHRKVLIRAGHSYFARTPR